MGYETERLKEQISMDDIAERYGIEMNRARFANCPFHNDKTPSMKLYDRYFKCFGCNEGGDIFALVMKLCGVSFQEALKRIKADFGLSTEVYAPNPEWESKKLERKRIKEKKELLIKRFIKTRQRIEQLHPVVVDGEIIISETWVKAINEINEIEYELELI